MRVVVFDLDKTLASCNVSFRFGRFLYKRGVLSFFQMLALCLSYFFHKIGLISLQRLHEISFQKLFFGKEKAKICHFVEEFLKEEGATLFRPSIEKELEKAKLSGARIWLQSSSPDFLVSSVAQIVGIECVTATYYEIDSKGRFSSIAQVVTGEVKKNLVEKFLQTNQLSWHEVIVYSDSEIDLPLLEMAGVAIIVYPERKLRHIAKERNWQIIDE